MQKRRRTRAVAWIQQSTALAALVLVAVVGTALAAPQRDLRDANQSVEAALATLEHGDVAGASAAYSYFETAWPQLEDGIRGADRTAYRAIEGAMLDVNIALRAEPVDTPTAQRALATLRDTNARFIASTTADAGDAAPDAASVTDTERLKGLLTRLDAGRAAIARQDATAALAAVKVFQADWPAIEGTIKAKSDEAYLATETGMGEAQALLASRPPKLAEADALLARMRERLAPIADSGASYGVFDAFIILLREGLEALLVVGALLAFLKKSDNANKQPWIWAGAGGGALLSFLLALTLQQIFSRAAAGIGSELVEGITGLAAAAMLFYVSYWLHSKAQLGAWQRYIRAQTTIALARGSVLSLAFIALLAVFREGAETAVFYLGIAPSIALGDLLLGAGLGLLALVALGVALLSLGVRLPMRPFFLASSALIFYLGFKFVGTGLHALQVAGVLRSSPAPLPTSDALGVYPTWETALSQLALLLSAGVVIWLTSRRTPPSRHTPATA